MYEIMMYAGAAGVILFFLLSVFLFIKNKVPSAILYFINLKRKGVDIWSANKKQPKKSIKKIEKTEFLESAESENNSYEPTEFLDEIKENSEDTEFLPEYSEK
jgi:hypothetical protein